MPPAPPLTPPAVSPTAPPDYPRDADGWPDINSLVTEDDTPVDNPFSEFQRRLLVEPLHSAWQGGPERRPFVAASDVGVFFGDGPTPLVPDAFLSLDVEIRDELIHTEHRSYFVWKFGKPPDVAIEIVSNRKGGEVGAKRRGYARGGVGHYAVYDPHAFLRGAPLRAYRLAGSRYQPVPEVIVPGTPLLSAALAGELPGPPPHLAALARREHRRADPHGRRTGGAGATGGRAGATPRRRRATPRRPSGRTPAGAGRGPGAGVKGRFSSLPPARRPPRPGTSATP